MTDEDALELVVLAFLMPAIAAILLFGISAATYLNGLKDISYMGAISATCMSVAPLGGIVLAYVFKIDLINWIAGS